MLKHNKRIYVSTYCKNGKLCDRFYYMYIYKTCPCHAYLLVVEQ